MKNVGVTIEVTYRYYVEWEDISEDDFEMLKNGDMAPIFENEDIMSDIETSGECNYNYTMADLDTGKMIVDWE